MKRLLFIVFFASFSTQAITSELIPYLGLNARMRDLGFQKGYGKENFQSTMPEGEVIAGLKVHPYLGFELGYLTSFERHRETTTSYPAQTLGDLYISPIDTETAISTSKIKGGSFNMVGFFPVSENIQILASVGLSRLNIKLRYMPIANNDEDGHVEPLPQDAIDESIRDFARSKYIPQAKVGIQYMLTQTVGLKALVGWEGTKRFNLLTNKQNTAARVSLKDSYTAGLGLAWYFN